jgi:hypothetical protein
MLVDPGRWLTYELAGPTSTRCANFPNSFYASPGTALLAPDRLLSPKCRLACSRSCQTHRSLPANSLLKADNVAAGSCRVSENSTSSRGPSKRRCRPICAVSKGKKQSKHEAEGLEFTNVSLAICPVARGEGP